MDVLRTPPDRFDHLPDFDYTPLYAVVPDDAGGELRMAYVEAGPPTGQSRCCCTVNWRGPSSTGT